MDMRAVVPMTDFRRRSQQTWWATLERARVNLGVRCRTIAVSERDWIRHWREGRDPVSALLTELWD